MKLAPGLAPQSIDRDHLSREIPLPMQEARRWLAWKFLPALNGGKPRKVPIYLDGSPRRGRLDSPEDVARLGTFAEALTALRPGVGLGFALGAGWQGIDLDGDVAVEAYADSLPGYVERSPSGHGVHAIGFGAEFGAMGPNGQGVEAYCGGRFFTVTGNSLGGDIEDLAPFVARVLDPTRRQHSAAPVDMPIECATSAQVADIRSALAAMRADDREVWVANGHRLKALGDVGRGLWIEWSQTSEKYDAADASRVWDSLIGDRTGFRSVFAAAKKSGWLNPRTKAAPEPVPEPLAAYDILETAITARAAGDVGACVTADAEAAWREIYAADRAEFLRLRDQAKRAGARMGEIDAAMTRRAPASKPSASSQPVMDDGWQQSLIRVAGKNDEWRIPSRVENIRLILDNAEEFSGRLAWDLFAEKPMIDGHLYEDHHAHEICAVLEKRWLSGNVAQAHLLAGIELAQRARAYHPVKDYLEKCVWDGVARIETFFRDYLGTPDDAYHRGAARALFVSAIKRIYTPGSKVDTTTVLQGPQGKFKTEMWLTLFSPWAAEVTERLDSKDFAQSLRGMWCMDFGELAGLGKAEWADVKRILTSRSDHYRPTYGRQTITRPRSCIFVGGTNDLHFNFDHTGGRRWIPIRVTEKIALDRVLKDRDALWAEARMLEADAGNWWDISDADEHQENIRIADSWEEPIAAWLVGIVAGFTTTEVLRDALRIEIGRHDHAAQTRVGKILQRLGYGAVQVREGGGRVRKYFKAGNAPVSQRTTSARPRFQENV